MPTAAPSSDHAVPPGLRLLASPLLAGGLLTAAVLIAYHNSLSGPFVFDDRAAILENPSIRHLWPLGSALSPPTNAGGVCGRPVANLSLAVNYAISGTRVWSYHAFNLLVHLLATLTLFGVVRRTLMGPDGKGQGAKGKKLPIGPGQPEVPVSVARLRPHRAGLLAFAIALLWAVHPLLTESVTFVVQRNESLMGLFYLLTIYCFIRGVEATTRPLTTDHKTTPKKGPVVRGLWFRGLRSDRSLSWFIGAVLVCLLGMATKEVMVTAPVIVFLYDRTFVAGGFRAAWRRRWPVHVALTSTWLLLAWLMLGAHGRAGTVGFGFGVSAWAYALKQCQALVHYLRLAAWPHPLVVDYGVGVIHSLSAVWWQALVVPILLGLTAWALVKRPRTGFLGAAFFVILAPSSSFVPLITQTVAEHRMYLPLAAVIAAVVLSLEELRRRLSLGSAFIPVVALALAVPLTSLTLRRNSDYRSDLALWGQTVAACPGNARAHYNYGAALGRAGRASEAMAQYRAALRLMPDYTDVHYNLANLLMKVGRTQDAIRQYEAAVRLDPNLTDAQNNLGNALISVGRTAEGIRRLEIVLRLRPDDAEAHFNLGVTLLGAGRLPEAITHLQAVVRLTPRDAEARIELARALMESGHPAAAAAQLKEALRLDPGQTRAREALEAIQQEIGGGR